MEEWERLAAGCPLFCGFDAARIPGLLEESGAYRERFAAGDEIPPERAGRGRLGIVLSGSLNVRAHGGDSALLNRIDTGGIFGVSYLFGSGGAKTHLLCREGAEILFIHEDRGEALWAERVIRQNLLAFLTDRICFLNEKIASLTAGDAVEKVAHALSVRADENGAVELPFSYGEWAKSLGLGRASLYRALDALEKNGQIRREKKRIVILPAESETGIW